MNKTVQSEFHMNLLIQTAGVKGTSIKRALWLPLPFLSKATGAVEPPSPASWSYLFVYI